MRQLGIRLERGRHCRVVNCRWEITVGWRPWGGQRKSRCRRRREGERGVVNLSGYNILRGPLPLPKNDAEKFSLARSNSGKNHLTTEAEDWRVGFESLTFSED